MFGPWTCIWRLYGAYTYLVRSSMMRMLRWNSQYQPGLTFTLRVGIGILYATTSHNTQWNCNNSMLLRMCDHSISQKLHSTLIWCRLLKNCSKSHSRHRQLSRVQQNMKSLHVIELKSTSLWQNQNQCHCLQMSVLVRTNAHWHIILYRVVHSVPLKSGLCSQGCSSMNHTMIAEALTFLWSHQTEPPATISTLTFSGEDLLQAWSALQAVPEGVLFAHSWNPIPW